MLGVKYFPPLYLKTCAKKRDHAKCTVFQRDKKRFVFTCWCVVTPTLFSWLDWKTTFQGESTIFTFGNSEQCFHKKVYKIYEGFKFTNPTPAQPRSSASTNTMFGLVPLMLSLQCPPFESACLAVSFLYFSGKECDCGKCGKKFRHCSENWVGLWCCLRKPYQKVKSSGLRYV